MEIHRQSCSFYRKTYRNNFSLKNDVRRRQVKCARWWAPQWMVTSGIVTAPSHWRCLREMIDSDNRLTSNKTTIRLSVNIEISRSYRIADSFFFMNKIRKLLYYWRASCLLSAKKCCERCHCFRTKILSTFDS